MFLAREFLIWVVEILFRAIYNVKFQNFLSSLENLSSLKWLEVYVLNEVKDKSVIKSMSWLLEKEKNLAKC